MWIPTPFAKTRRALPGLPWRPLTDEQYEAACKLHPGIEDQGYFFKEEPKPVEADPRKRRATEEE